MGEGEEEEEGGGDEGRVGCGDEVIFWLLGSLWFVLSRSMAQPGIFLEWFAEVHDRNEFISR